MNNIEKLCFSGGIGDTNLIPFFADSIDEAEKGDQIPRKTVRKDLNPLYIMLI